MKIIKILIGVFAYLYIMAVMANVYKVSDYDIVNYLGFLIVMVGAYVQISKTLFK